MSLIGKLTAVSVLILLFFLACVALFILKCIKSIQVSLSCIPYIKLNGGQKTKSCLRPQLVLSGIFYPKNCFLNLDDDDEGTLNLVTQFTDTYLTHQSVENEADGDGNSSDSSSSDSDSDSENFNVPFELREEDKKFDSDVERFKRGGVAVDLMMVRSKTFFLLSI